MSSINKSVTQMLNHFKDSNGRLLSFLELMLAIAQNQTDKETKKNLSAMVLDSVTYAIHLMLTQRTLFMSDGGWDNAKVAEAFDDTLCDLLRIKSLVAWAGIDYVKPVGLVPEKDHTLIKELKYLEMTNDEFVTLFMEFTNNLLRVSKTNKNENDSDKVQIFLKEAKPFLSMVIAQREYYLSRKAKPGSEEYMKRFIKLIGDLYDEKITQIQVTIELLEKR